MEVMAFRMLVISIRQVGPQDMSCTTSEADAGAAAGWPGADTNRYTHLGRYRFVPKVGT